MIFDHQKNELSRSIRTCNIGIGFCSAFLGSYGLGVVLTGLYMCCKSARQAICGITLTRLRDPVVGEGMHYDTTDRYIGYSEAVRQDPRLSNSAKAALVVLLGVIVIGLCVPTIVILNYLIDDYDAEKSNLEDWQS